MKFRFSKIFILSIITTLFFSVTSCKKGSGTNIDIPGVQGPTVSLNLDEVVINMVVESVVIDGSMTYPFPKMDYSYVEISKDEATGGAALRVVLSLQDLLGGNTIFPPQYLPGGRALPGVPSGNLPSIAVTIPKLKNVTLYIGTKVFGIFVPVNMNVDNSILTFRYYVSGKRSGNLSLVGKDPEGKNSGVLLLLDMKGSTKKYLRKIAKKYKHLH